MEPELAAWAGTFKTNAILADIYDLLAQINANLVAGFSRRRSPRPKRYPRPGADDKQRIGKDALSYEDLDAWFEKRKGGGVNG